MQSNKTKLRLVMTEQEIQKEKNSKFQGIKFCIVIAQVIVIGHLVQNTRTNNYTFEFFNYINWISWFLVNIFAILGSKYDNRVLLRIAHHLTCIRQVVIIYNLEGRKDLKELSQLVELTQIQSLGLQILFFIPMSLVERAFVHISFSLVYQAIFSFGLLSLNYQFIG